MLQLKKRERRLLSAEAVDHDAGKKDPRRPMLEALLHPAAADAEGRAERGMAAGRHGA